jgi:hypothetical protein
VILHLLFFNYLKYLRLLLFLLLPLALDGLSSRCNLHLRALLTKRSKVPDLPDFGLKLRGERCDVGCGGLLLPEAGLDLSDLAHVFSRLGQKRGLLEGLLLTELLLSVVFQRVLAQPGDVQPPALDSGGEGRGYKFLGTALVFVLPLCYNRLSYVVLPAHVLPGG